MQNLEKKDNLVSLEYSIAICIFTTLILQSKITYQQNVEKREPLYTTDRNESWYSQCGK